jgi:hypothetical protein
MLRAEEEELDAELRWKRGMLFLLDEVEGLIGYGCSVGSAIDKNESFIA